MSNLNDGSFSPEHGLDLKDPSPRGSMLITLFLIICALVLASLMMFHYGRKISGSDERMKYFSLALLKERRMATTTPLTKVEDDAPADPPTVQKERIDERFSQLIQSRNESVRWPKLKLTGFGRSGDGDGGFAIINGKQIHLDQTSKEQVKLVEIRSHDVIVEYMGEQQILTVDVKN